MTQPEHIVQNRIRLGIKPSEACIFRNNVGLAWTGKTERISRAGMVRVEPGDVVVRGARPFHAGLCEGSGDLIGWRSVEITSDMVGSRVAVFTSIEVKANGGRPTKPQLHWHNRLLSDGGLSVIAKNVEEARKGLALPVN